jgi:hypothetical protein
MKVVEEACSWMKLLETPMKAKIDFFSNFCHESCRGGLFMDETVGNSNESKN